MLYVPRALLMLSVLLVLLPVTAAPPLWNNPVTNQPVPLGEVPPFRNGDTVLFSGDSITRWDMCYPRYIEAFWLTRYPQVRVKYINGGISGTGAGSLLARFDYDIAGWQPSYITLMLGMNDVGWRHFEPDVTPEAREKARQELAERWTKDMGTLIDRMRGLHPRACVVISPTVFDEYTRADLIHPTIKGLDPELGRLGEIALRLARER
ncbi:MAG TPA: GDSL-type esterase/lipase family protein, partial [Armatimonadota bacterium]